MALVKAYLKILSDGPDKNKKVPVHFNPQSLQITYQAQGPDGSQQLDASGKKQGARDQQTGSIASISMDLLFDTTERGTNVQNDTILIAGMIRPAILHGRSAPPPPLVLFSWGSFVFTGKVLSLSETIDFFSEQGVPLRSTVKLTMSEVERARGNPGLLAALNISIGIGLSASAGVSVGAEAGVGFSASASLSAGIDVGTTPLTLAQAGDSLQALAGRAGLDASWKAIAAANNIDNPRAIPPGTPINLNAGASLSGGGVASASANFGTGL